MKTFLSPLTPDEEAACMKKMQEGDLEARNTMIERNMRLVAHVAKKYQNVGEDLEELISIGTIGLIKAVNTFNPGRGNRLAAYAARCIDNELLMYLRSKKKTSQEVSLQEPIGTDKEGNQIHYLDIVDNNQEDVFDKIMLRKNVIKLYDILPKVLERREQEIMILRYGLYNKRPVTQREIAKRLGISRSYVSRIEKRAIEKLRLSFEENN